MGRTSIDDIAREARVSRATIYNHFPGKQELIQHWLEAEQASILEAVGAFLSSTGAPDSAPEARARMLEAGFLFVVDAIRNHPVVRRAQATDPVQIAQVIAAGSPAIVSRARRCFADVLAPFLPTDGPTPERAAEWLTRQALLLAIAPTDEFDLEDPEDRRAIARLTTAGLCASNALKP